MLVNTQIEFFSIQLTFFQLCYTIIMVKEMKQDTFANRLRKAMDIRNFKQIDLVNKTKLDKSLINKYLNGISEAGSDKLTILSNALDVNEVWLMGYDVPMNEENNSQNNELNELDEILFSKAKELSDEDKKMVIGIINAIKRDVDKEDSI